MKLILVLFAVICFVVAEKSAEVCKEPVDAGPCRANMPRFYYDSAQKQCQTFIYGGCKGNGNNFGSAEECQKLCANV